MNKISILAVLFALVAGSAVFAAGGDVKWVTLKEGIIKARTEKKPMIVDFYYGKGCPRCEKLEKGIYSDPKIAKKINDDFVPILIDLSKPLSKEEDDLGGKYDFKNDCLMLFLDPEMNIIRDPSEKKMCFSDHIEPAIFIGYLNMVIERMKK